MTYRQKALEIARAELGVHESPAGSNSGKRVNEYLRSTGLGPGYPWCMAFVNWCYRKAGVDLKHPNEASVGFFEDFARRNGWLVPPSKVSPGDIVCYRFDSDDWPDHVGIVEFVGPNRITVIEGNTAVGNDANGGQVMRRTRSRSRCKFVRIPGGTTPPKPKPKPPADDWQPLPGPAKKPPWFWDALKEWNRRRKKGAK